MDYRQTVYGSAQIDDHRRKWDTYDFEQKAKARKEEQEDPKKDQKKEKKKLETLKPRDFKIDLDSKLGKSQVVSTTAPLSQQGGYYCDVCDCVVKDSINFLDHINGKKHQRNMGMSMKIEKSTLDQVKNRLELMKKKQTEEKDKEYNIQERLTEIREEEEKLKSLKKEKARAKKRKAELFAEQDNEIAAQMGFGGFGSAKKS